MPTYIKFAYFLQNVEILTDKGYFIKIEHVLTNSTFNLHLN